MAVLFSYLLVDFALLVASRAAEPTVYRVLSLTLAMALIREPARTDRFPFPGGAFGAGVAGGVSVVSVYVLNLFILAALGVAGLEPIRIYDLHQPHLPAFGLFRYRSPLTE